MGIFFCKSGCILLTIKSFSNRCDSSFDFFRFIRWFSISYFHVYEFAYFDASFWPLRSVKIYLTSIGASSQPLQVGSVFKDQRLVQHWLDIEDTINQKHLKVFIWFHYILSLDLKLLIRPVSFSQCVVPHFYGFKIHKTFIARTVTRALLLVNHICFKIALR